MISIGPPGQGMSGISNNGSRPRRRKKKVVRPVAVICYICGRQYGRSSLGIHLRQCKKLWEKREALKPEYERKSLPRPPENFERAIESGDIEHMDDLAINQQNTAAFDSYNTEALNQCQHCGRSFLPEPLKIHLRSCRPGRLIGEKLKAHSGKAGGNLGLKADPRNINYDRPKTTGSGERGRGGGGRRGGSAERVSLRDRIAAAAGGKHHHDADGDDFGQVILEGGYDEHGVPPRSAPTKTTMKTTMKSSSSSALARSGALQMRMRQSPSGRGVAEISTSTESRREYGSGGGSGGGGSPSEKGTQQDQWHEAWDPKSGRDFYYNNKGETRWTLPPHSNITLHHPGDSPSRSVTHKNTSNVAAAKEDNNENHHHHHHFEEEDHVEEEDEDEMEREKKRERERQSRTRRVVDQEESEFRVQTLEKKVNTLEDKLEWAVSEIDRLSKQLKKFQRAFAED